VLLTIGLWPGILISLLETVTANILWRAGTDQKVLALTFDDGPHEVYTPQLLQILAGQEVIFPRRRTGTPLSGSGRGDSGGGSRSRQP
jgi:hypothetical protein